MIVVDASVAVAGAVSEGGFDALRDEECVAPPLLWSEVTSSLRELGWRRDIDTATAVRALERFLSAPIRMERPAGLHLEAYRVAERLGWAKTYDAEYIALARLLDVRLLTRDARLRRGAASAARVTSPEELV